MENEGRLPGAGGYRGRVEALVERESREIAAALGLELVDVEYIRQGGRRFLRVFIEKRPGSPAHAGVTPGADGEGPPPSGVTLDDCQAFSRRLSDRLDALDPIPENYYLEVSSPGLDRPLKRDQDFELFRGRPVVVKTFAPHDGRREFTGRLEGLVDGRVVLRDASGRVWEIPREMVARARLHF